MKNLSEILRRIRGSWFWQLVDTHKKFPHILIEKRTICTVVQI